MALGCAFSVAMFGAGVIAGRLRADVPRVFHARIASPSPSWKYVAVYHGASFVPRLNSTTASQCAQDLTIADIFGRKRDGVFLDLAANDAFKLSNTLSLEQTYGWRGVCVEPNPVYAPGYLHRTCQLVQAVVGPRDGVKVDFNFRKREYGGIVGFDNREAANQTELRYTVSMKRLLTDFNMPKTIDYLSLDIEGAEAWIFESFPWESYRFLVMTVERPNPALKEMLESNGYVHVCNHGTFGDEMWFHRTLSKFEALREKYGARKQCRPWEPPCS